MKEGRSEDREGFEADEWDPCFPKYPTRDLAEAIGRYWDEYYDHANDLARRFPDRVRIVSTELAVVFRDLDEVNHG